MLTQQQEKDGKNQAPSHPVNLGVNSHSPCGSEERKVTVVSTSKVKSIQKMMSNRNLQGRGREGTHRAIPPDTTSGGQSGGRFGRGGGCLGTPRTATLQPRQHFEGDIPELHGKTYELVGNKSADLYTETTKHIASYIALKCQHGGNIWRAVET